MILSDVVRHSSRLYADRTAISSSTGTLTHRQFEASCQALGQALLGLGLRPGDRVALLDFNTPVYCLAHFGLPGCGLVFIPLNHRLAPAEVVDILADAQARALMYSPAFEATVEEMRPRLSLVRHFIRTGPGGNDPDLDFLMGRVKPPLEIPRPAETDLGHLLYTSGTTGKPKGVMLSQANSTATIASLLVEWGLTPQDVGLMVAPLFHVAACHSFMALIARGCAVHLLPGFNPAETLAAIQEKKVSFCLLVPAMIAALLNLPGQEKFDLSSLRTVIYAGAPMPEELLKAALNRFGNVFAQVYGLTETSALTCLPKEAHQLPGVLTSAGRQMFGTEVLVVDDQGREAEPGQIGEVVARGGNVTSGYWRAEEETAQVLKEGWFHTGDMAYGDDQGYIFLKDRKKEMIVSGGENVYPVEVENVLHKIPAVQEAAVIGVPDPKWGEKVLALVHLRPGQEISPQDILDFCSQRLAGYKCPKVIEFTGPLPRTSSGKIHKKVLRDKYWAGQDRAIH
ncbi:MAG: long-chain-fatty-acid--CoA ligase [Deltaproteobacteria bacterium]|nr:long-chain-fatty-acid--CoA ligase [Deltaproteobacteria bacterium]